jgi:hypothetical protein
MLRLTFYILLGLFFPGILCAHANELRKYPSDSLPVSFMQSKKVLTSDFLVPVIGLGYGIASIHLPALYKTDQHLQERWANENPNQRKRLDDFILFLPAVYALGKSTFTDPVDARNRMYGRFMATKLIQYGAVYTSKFSIGRRRPDGTSNLSLPSGHTAEAFANAEFLRMYVGKEQPWVAVLGYVIAAGTGFLRIYNNRHWFSDVVAGAAVGYGSARLGSWSFDRVNLLLQQRKAASNQALEAPSF